MKSISADIIFLQETDIKHNEQRLLRCYWFSQLFQSTFSCRARGMAIVFCKTITFNHISTICDPNGRYVIVSGLIFSVHIMLLNIYGPNYDDSLFGGDFNLVLDPILDRTLTRSMGHLPKYTTTLKKLVNSLIWRLKHLTDRNTLFFSHVHSSYSRIDFFSWPNLRCLMCNTIKHPNSIISDHFA